MGCPWAARKLPVGIPWYARGLPMGCPWDARGTVSNPTFIKKTKMHISISIDKANDCVMKSERRALDRGADPPSGCSVHNAAGGAWRAPARCLIQTHLGVGV